METPETSSAELIVKELDLRFGIKVGTQEDDKWETDELGHEQLSLGRWVATADDEDLGLYEGDEGVVIAQVVGSPEHRNERVKITFTLDDFDPGSGPEIVLFEDIEPVDAEPIR